MSSFVLETPAHLFESVEPRLEDDFLAQILRCSSVLFPRYYTASWNPLVRDIHGHGCRPDMVLISRVFDEWYVVEVELATHPLFPHIDGQLETLSHGIYDRRLVESLHHAVPQAGEAVLADLVYRAPGLLCIVNEYTEGISRACRNNHFELAVFEPFHSKTGGWALLVQKLPSELIVPVEAGTYELRFDRDMGDQVVMTLPRHFPPQVHELEIICGPVNRIMTVSVYLLGGNRRSLFLPAELVPMNKHLRLEMIDPDRKLAKLVVG